jgi:hypothetical protein
MQLTDKPPVVLLHDTLIIDGRPYEYIPIAQIEKQLNEFFGLYSTQIIACNISETDVTIIKRIIVKKHEMDDKISLDVEFFPVYQDGIAAVQITPETPLPLAISICNSIALKNAAENFGVVFGRDLNRLDIDMIRNKKLSPDTRIRKEYAAAVAAQDTDKINFYETKYDFKANG